MSACCRVARACVGVAVGVCVGVAVGVCVGVAVGVCVGVAVEVCVGVAVEVCVGVAVEVCVGVAVEVCVGVAVGCSVGVAAGACAGAVESCLAVSAIAAVGCSGVFRPVSTCRWHGDGGQTHQDMRGDPASRSPRNSPTSQGYLVWPSTGLECAPAAFAYRRWRRS